MISKGFFILRARYHFKRLSSSCPGCRRLKKLQVQALQGPSIQLQAFTNMKRMSVCYIDCQGPYKASISRFKTKKLFLLNVTCVVTRYTIIQPLEDMSANSILMALRQAFLQVGTEMGCILYSDQGSNLAPLMKLSQEDNNIEEERKQIMILELGLCMDKYVSAYSDHETFYIRQTGQDFPDQIENMLWETNEVVEEVKDAIRDHTSRNGFTMSKEREVMDEEKSLFHKWPDIMEGSAGEACKKSPTNPSELPIPSPTISPGTFPSSSQCSQRTCPSCASLQSTSSWRILKCSPEPGRFRPSRTWPGLCTTSSPGTGRSGMLPPSLSPWSRG